MPADDVLALLCKAGFRSDGIGPLPEWAPVKQDEFQQRHNAFWHVVSVLLPDNELDEEYWMTNDATEQLLNN